MNSVLAERPASDFMDDQFVQICYRSWRSISTNDASLNPTFETQALAEALYKKAFPPAGRLLA